MWLTFELEHPYLSAAYVHPHAIPPPEVVAGIAVPPMGVSSADGNKETADFSPGSSYSGPP